MDSINAVFTDLFLTIYRYTGFGLLFGFFFILAITAFRKNGIKATVKNFCRDLIKNPTVRWQFLFAIYLFMTLARTLICRNIWQAPWADIIGNWGLYTKEGTLNFEGFENVFLFLPLMLFFYLAFAEKYGEYKLYKLCWHAVKWSFLFSAAIEICQLFGRLGTFQLADIAQNTLGGLLGALIYWIAERIYRNIKKRKG